MIALTSPYFWYTTRATGLVALMLFTLVVSLGTFVANRIGGTVVGRFEVNELHRSLSMIAMAFLAIHVATTVLDSYVSTGFVSIFVPLTSAYKRIDITIGAIAMDLCLAVWISSLLKARIKYESWRFIHWLSWLFFATALVHSFLTGTDARHGWGLLIILSCAATGAIAALWRFLGRPSRAAGRTALSPLARAARQPHPKGPGPSQPLRPSQRNKA
jgi:predicted ferric reductase